MVNRVLTVSLLAGLLAGLVIAALQHVTTTPLILKAETYEAAMRAAAPSFASFDGQARVILAHGPAGDAAGHDHAEWKPQDGLQRTAFTTLVTVATAIGFAALLLGAMIAANETIDDRRALAWAVCGFLAFGLVPAAGLAPELPGSAAAELLPRQIWWVATALVTAGGLFVFLRMEAGWLRALAVLAMLVPHLIGAPHPAAPESKVPAEIAAHFTALSLSVQAALWLATGLAVGVIWPRMTRKDLATRRAAKA
ncbi:CbtA family protein [Bosea psychrotolerans]|uniref:Cobalt transporter subunit CbtA n=1 Tax=Bosea psychrotolerans TaxID=1871628 RepID=A0A2S4MEK0_9HYPH|nr:CbtA family protein [Bosea psychrotolerans]POR53188.1 cobalt transporter subunit CbtA [Bosea psychrotolerans]